MEVEVEVYKWTPTGMIRTNDTTGAWVEVRTFERELEAAHARGKREGLEKAQQIIMETQP